MEKNIEYRVQSPLAGRLRTTEYRGAGITHVLRTLFSVLCALVITCPSHAQDWKEMGSDHFICYFTADDVFAKEVLDKAETYYRQIALDLGYPRYSEFWTYDKRVKIYVYPEHNAFLKATDQPGWSHGMADYENKEIIGYLRSDEFTDSVLPHEMAHLIFRDFVGFTGVIPLWLDEGVAQAAEYARKDYFKNLVKELYADDRLLSLDDLMKLDIRRFKDLDRVYVRATRDKEGNQVALFFDTDSLISNYYLVSVSLINFLIDKYGSDRFSYFCRELRDGKTVDEALKFAYSPSILGIEDLETKWRGYLAGQ